MWKGLSLEGEIVRYPSVSLSSTLGRNEKVEQHIRKKTHKPNILRFWVEGNVIPLYVWRYISTTREKLPVREDFLSRIILFKWV